MSRNQERVKAPTPFLFFDPTDLRYNALITEHGGTAFSRLLEIPTEVSDELAITCKQLIDQYCSLSTKAIDFSIQSNFQDEDLLAIVTTQQEAVHKPLFIEEDEKPRAQIFFNLSAECFALIEQVDYMGSYESAQDLYGHIVYFTLWRHNFTPAIKKPH